MARTISARLHAASLLTASVVLVACGSAQGGTVAADEPGAADGGSDGGAGSPNPGPPTRVGLELIADGLTAPVALAAPADGSGRRFIADQIGLILLIDGEGRLADEPFLDLRSRVVDLNDGYDERGLLGLAFHPDFGENGRFFVYYSGPLREGAPDGYDHTAYLSEVRVSPEAPNRADPTSERVLLAVDQPQANHNGGTIAFGPDGYLYLSLGDGGGANDAGRGHPPLGNGQDVTTLLGSILRLDVDGDAPYEIPPDNPFVGTSGRDEIYAYGLRNPYRFSFDREEGRLLAGDVGQNLYEEIDVVERGGNYGWNLMEGTHCFDPTRAGNPPASCPETGPRGEPLLLPVIEYSHGTGALQGTAVVGGYVYRGDAVPGLRGQYVFGDWSAPADGTSGMLFVAEPRAGEGLWNAQPLEVEGRGDGALGHFLLAFGEDASGELYVLTSDQAGPSGQTGRVYRVTR